MAVRRTYVYSGGTYTASGYYRKAKKGATRPKQYATKQGQMKGYGSTTKTWKRYDTPKKFPSKKAAVKRYVRSVRGAGPTRAARRADRFTKYDAAFKRYQRARTGIRQAESLAFKIAAGYHSYGMHKYGEQVRTARAARRQYYRDSKGQFAKKGTGRVRSRRK